MTDCYCDYDPATVYKRRHIKAARKKFKCEECAEWIEVGQPYEYVFAIWEGCVSELRTCHRCWALRQWVQNNIPCLCWAHGNLHQDMEDAIEAAYERAREEVTGVRFGFLRRKHHPERYLFPRAA